MLFIKVIYSVCDFVLPFLQGSCYDSYSGALARAERAQRSTMGYKIL